MVFFFRSVRAAVDLPDTGSLQDLCTLALWSIAAHIEQWVAFFVLDEYTEQRRRGLRRWQT